MASAAELLREARSRAGLTQDDLAVRAGVTQSVISAYERGHREPALSTLQRLIDATGSHLVLHIQPAPPAAHQRPSRSGQSHRPGTGASQDAPAPAALPATRRGALLRRRRRAVARAAAADGASVVGVFGSVARGEDRPDSDIDLLVHLPADATLVTLSRLRRALSDALGGEPVDVVPDDGLKPDVARSIQRDLIRL